MKTYADFMSRQPSRQAGIAIATNINPGPESVVELFGMGTPKTVSDVLAHHGMTHIPDHPRNDPKHGIANYRKIANGNTHYLSVGTGHGGAAEWEHTVHSGIHTSEE